jgi:hypothetical protein
MGAAFRRDLFLALLLVCASAATVVAQSGKAPPETIPAEFPKDCPIFPGATYRDMQQASRNGVKIGVILVLDTAATEAAVVEFYKRELPAKGWSLLKHPKSPGDTLEATKDGGRRIILGFVATHQGPNPSTTFRLFAATKH